MEIRMIFVWVCFIFCLGLTTGGILVLFRDIKSGKLPSFRYLQYYLILIYTFGFYALWSKVFFLIFFSSTTTPEENKIVTNFLIVLGIPFLVTGKLMLVWWSMTLLKKAPDIVFKAAAFMIIFLIILLYISINRFAVLSNMGQIYGVFVMTISVFIISILLFSEVNYLAKKQKQIFILLVLWAGLIYVLVFLENHNQAIIELIFIFLFFLTNTALAIYFTYAVKLVSEVEETPVTMSFDTFIEKYTITPREAEIVQFIYQGKTNQEIADKLFVTVQTIKDHTHRIYQKTEVKSRAQLTSLLQKFYK
ncbi:helix-turn-helix transcriptional regulator [Emticicia sp. C21]|uniref:helix-turn-helix transcriptional regulator n=1 Tax=Emticicia sp. C21 TaxID=2302915 RepID=UPI000E34CF22|nr:helix-turn-helix transcriptional regulator [Emticicia sp. C21]RFS16776.1 LuxR family transcriptional regulator [Emticicia sp. C21]